MTYFLHFLSCKISFQRIRELFWGSFLFCQWRAQVYEFLVILSVVKFFPEQAITHFLHRSGSCHGLTNGMNTFWPDSCNSWTEALYRGILSPYCICPKNSASSRPYREINGYNLQEFDTRTTLSLTNTATSRSMLSESLLGMAFRCGQNIQIAKCYSKSKILVEMYKIWCENYIL